MSDTITMDVKFDQAISTAIAAAAAAALAWFLGTFKKVDKRQLDDSIRSHEAQISVRFVEIQKRLDYWEAQAGKFATRDMIDSLKMEMKTDLGRVEKGIDDLRSLIIQEIRNK